MIEDDVFLIKLYRDQLTREGFEFITATTGVEGVNKVIAEHPDLILLDLILPRKNGFDVLRDIKSNPATKHIPVLILSNLAQEQDIQEGLALGADDYLIKTEMRLSDIIEKIKSTINKTK